MNLIDKKLKIGMARSKNIIKSELKECKNNKRIKAEEESFCAKNEN